MRTKLEALKKVWSSNKQPIITISLLGCVVVSYQNCQNNGDFYQIPSSALAISTPPTDNIVTNDGDVKVPDKDVPLCQNGSTEDLICNPLSGGTTGGTTGSTAGGTAGGGSTGGSTTGGSTGGGVVTSRSGLIASLYEGQANFNSMDRYAAEGYKHPENIYFSNFDIPNHSFSDGFTYGAGEYLKNRVGEKLIEWFSIKARGHIVLPATMEEGFYHIASVSDDGVRITIDGNVVLNNSNTHAQTTDCSSLVEFKKGVEKDFVLDYFQGPRYYIALTTMIKKVDPATYSKSKLCGSGNGPEALAKEGYSVIGPEWFTLPSDF
jgi:hypothetical protein